MGQKNIKISAILLAISLLLFFGVYYLYFDKAYFKASLIANSFIMPVVYAGGALINVLSTKKEGFLNFKKAFSSSFIPMFIAGFITLISIYTFFNYVNPEAKNRFNTEFVANNKQDLDSVYQKERSRLVSQEEIKKLDADYQKSLQSFKPELTKNIDVLHFNYFLRYGAVILLFYTLISLFFAAFFRNRLPR